MATYYLDGNTLANSSAVYTDVNLTLCAIDGYYSDGVISRQQTNCVLSAVEECVGCGVVLDCSSSISSAYNDTTQGVYSLNIDVDSSNTGAVVIRLLGTTNQAQGVRAIYNGVTYNEVSTLNEGYFTPTTPDGFAFLETALPTCTVAGTTFPSVPRFYYDGSAFQATGATESISVASGDVATRTMAFAMVIPKTSLLPDVLKFQVASLCGTTSSFQLQVTCPIVLTGFQVSNTYPSPPDPNPTQGLCGLPLVNTAYNVPISDSDPYGVPDLEHWVFSDPNGQYPLADGYYYLGVGSGGGEYMQVQNGVVISTGDCI